MPLLPPDPVFILKSDMDYVHCICFVEEKEEFSKTLLAATESGFVYIWDLDRNRLKSKHKMGESIQAVHSIGNKIVTQEKMGILKIWVPSEAEYEMVKSFSFGGGYCRSFIIDENLLLPQDKGALELITLNNLELIRTYKSNDENSGSVMCIEKATVKDKTYILAGYETGKIYLFDYLSGKVCNEIKVKEQITSIAYDEVLGRAIVGNSSNQIQLFTINNNLEMKLKCEISITNEGCNVVKIRPDRKIFVSGGWDSRIRVYSWKTLRILVVLTSHKKGITDVKFSPGIVEQHGSKIMACSSGDGCISLWNIYN